MKTKLLLFLTFLICVCSNCTQVEMESYDEVTVTVLDQNQPEYPGFSILISGNMRPQKFMLEWYIDDKKYYEKWTHLECNKEFPIHLDLKPGEYKLKVRIGINAGGDPYYIYDKSQNMIIK